MKKRYFAILIAFMIVFSYIPFIGAKVIAATTITRVDITVEPPIVGDTINKIYENYGGYQYDRPDKDAVATVPASAGYLVDGSNWILYDPNYGDAGNFYGTFQANTDYYASTLIVPKDGYTFSESCQYYVNGQKAVFAGGAGYGIAVCGKVRAVSKYTVSFNFNGGTNKSLSITSPVVQGTQITLPSVTTSNVTAPANKVFDAYEINGTRYNPGSKYTVNANTIIKLLWKDAQQSYTYNINLSNYNTKPLYGKSTPKYTITKNDSKINSINTQGTHWAKLNNGTWQAYTASTMNAGTYRYEVCLQVQKIQNNSQYEIVANIGNSKTIKLNNIKLDNSNSQYTLVYGFIDQYTLSNPNTTKKGDLDRNGVVDANDASVALELYKAQSATSDDIKIGDMDRNNLIDANDASLILEYYKTHQ